MPAAITLHDIDDDLYAALALEHGAVLVSDDARFQRVANLRILPGGPKPD